MWFAISQYIAINIYIYIGILEKGTKFPVMFTRDLTPTTINENWDDSAFRE